MRGGGVDAIRGIPVKKPPSYKKPPPLIRVRFFLRGGGFLVGGFGRRRKFWGFRLENDDFHKENRVRKV